MEFNKSEVEEAAWIPLELLSHTFDKQYIDMDGYQISSNMKTYEKPNCKINSQALFPLYRFNPKKQGLGKGHYLAMRYLLKENGLLHQYAWFSQYINEFKL